MVVKYLKEQENKGKDEAFNPSAGGSGRTSKVLRQERKA